MSDDRKREYRFSINWHNDPNRHTTRNTVHGTGPDTSFIGKDGNPPMREPERPLTTLEKAEERIAELERALRNEEAARRGLRHEVNRMQRLHVLEMGKMRLRAQALEARSGRLPAPLADLIQLCHPDRHPAGLHELANRVTAALLAAREKK